MFNWYSFRVKYICSDALPKKKRHTQGPCACVTPDERVCRGHVCRNWSSSVWRVKHRAKPHALNCNCGLYSFACFEVFSRQHSYLCSLGRNAHEASDHFFFSFWKERFVFSAWKRRDLWQCIYKGVRNKDVLLWPAWLLFVAWLFFFLSVSVRACEKHYAQSLYRNHVLVWDGFSTKHDVVSQPTFGHVWNQVT